MSKIIDRGFHQSISFSHLSEQFESDSLTTDSHIADAGYGWGVSPLPNENKILQPIKLIGSSAVNAKKIKNRTSGVDSVDLRAVL